MSADLGIRAAVRQAVAMELGDVWRGWLAGRETCAKGWERRTPYLACLYTQAVPDIRDGNTMSMLLRAPDLSRARA